METNIAVFRGKGIRKTIHKNEWWFSISDVVEALTDSTDPKQFEEGAERRIQEDRIRSGSYVR